MTGRTFCLSEDRPDEEAGLRVALCSIRRHNPGTDVVVYRPDPTPDFRAWIASGFPRVRLVPQLPPGAASWNCKPHVLLPLLRSGASEVVWIDSDVTLSRDCDSALSGIANDTIGVTQEPISLAAHGTELRTRGWNLDVGRRFSRTMNTAVLRVTPRHISLLEHWKELLETSEYRQWQARSFDDRPIHCMGDQDVLNALLGSREFADIPVHWLRTGRDVIHSGGALAYSLGERLGGLFRRVPPFIHGPGTKLRWAFDAASLSEKTGWWWYFRRLTLEVSPHFAEAKRYRDEIGLTCPWMDYSTPFGRINRWLGFGHFALRGLPLTLAATIIDRVAGWRPG